MFIVPLTVRNNLNNLVRYKPKESKIIINENVLYVLIWNNEYLENIQIPLMGQSSEKSKIKALFVEDAAFFIENGKIKIAAVTEKKYYELNTELEIQKEFKHGLKKTTIFTSNDKVLLFSNSTFYLVQKENLKNLKISPYFKSINNCDLGKSKDKEIIIYQTNSYTSVYTVDSEPIVPKYNSTEKIFISDEKIFILNQNEIIVYEIFNGLRPVEKIDIKLNIEAEWSYLFFLDEKLYLSGKSKDGYILYIDGYVFNTDALVKSFASYRNCLFCVNSSALFFLPNDGDFDLRLLESEKNVLNDVVSGKYTPYTFRRFDSLMNKNYNEVESKKLGKIGHFLGVIVYHGFKIECRKLLCNALSELKKDLKHLNKVKILQEILNFDYRIYKIFLDMNFDVEAIYDKITEMINPKVIDSNLLMKIIGVTFRDIDCLDNPEYYYLKGRHLMESNKNFLEFFYKAKGFYNEVVKTLEKHKKFKEIIEFGRKTGVYLGSSFDVICDSDYIPESQDFDVIYNIWELTSDRLSKISKFNSFINGKYELLVGTRIPRSLMLGLTVEIVKYCKENNTGFKTAIKLLSQNNCYKDVAYILYHQYKTTGNIEFLKECKNNIYNSVFLYESKFIGRETIETLLMSFNKEDYETVIENNRKKIKKMENEVVWTNVIKAESIPNAYREYLKDLNEIEKFYYSN